MGRRNMATVGTHRNYLADMLDERTGREPSLVTGCASAEDAATSYFSNIFENSNGMMRAATVVVWPASGDQPVRTVFDMRATLSACTADDAEPDEVDVLIEAHQRR